VTADDAGLDEGPRAVADCRDRLAGGHELLDEADRVLVHAQQVGVDGAAGQQQCVVLAGRGVRDQPVYRERSRGDQVELAGLDLPGVDRQEIAGGTGAVQRAPRLLEFDPLDSVGGEDRDPPSHPPDS
jgi:hypothetical protein